MALESAHFHQHLAVNTTLSPKTGYSMFCVCVCVSDIGQMACGRISATLSSSSIWVPFQVGSKASAIKERPHQRAEQYGHSGKNRRGFAKSSARGGFFPLLRCQGGRLCYLSRNERREKWKEASALQHAESPETRGEFLHPKQTVRDVMLHAQLHPLSEMSRRGHIYYFRKKSTNIESPHPPPRTISINSGQHIGLVMWFVMTKHFQQRCAAQKPLVTSSKFPLNKLSQWLSQCAGINCWFSSRPIIPEPPVEIDLMANT